MMTVTRFTLVVALLVGATGQSQAQQAEPAVEPEPAPTPDAEPESEPEPAPTPDAEPESEPEPAPAPAPAPEADPDSEPAPAPDSEPDVAEEPKPDQPQVPRAGTARPPPTNAPEEEDFSYWTITFQGTFLTPTGALKDSHEPGMGAAIRVGWTGNHNFGVQLVARHSPIPHKQDAITDIEAHMLYGTAALQYAGYLRSLRLWAALGGGYVAERVRTAYRQETPTVKWHSAQTAYVAAGVELHLFSNGGPGVAASYSHPIAGDNYSFYALSAGLTFVF